MEHWEQRVVVVVPGDLCHDHRVGDTEHMLVRPGNLTPGHLAPPVAGAGVCGPGGLRGEERGHRQKGGAAGGPGAPGHQDLVSW